MISIVVVQQRSCLQKGDLGHDAALWLYTRPPLKV